MTAEIVFTRESHLGLILLNRPQALNALNFGMIKALQHQLELWQADSSIQAVIVQAEGGKAFCAGGDIRKLYDFGMERDTEKMQFFWHEYRLNYYINKFRKPYIPLMDGITMGGGVGISLHGSHPVATERFSFAMPETAIGFFPDIGASYLLSHCPEQAGIYLGLTGNRLGARDAQALGLVKQVISSNKINSLVEHLLRTDLSTDAHHRVTACLREFASIAGEATIEKELPAINECFSATTMEGIIAALQEREDSWAKEILQNLEQKCPLSLKITLAQLLKARSMSLAECLQMDYCLVDHFIRGPNFYEGVRALLVDKDKSPRWQPDSLSQVSELKVADYFKCEQAELSFK